MGRVRKVCPVPGCSAQHLLRLPNHLSQVHKLDTQGKKHWLKRKAEMTEVQPTTPKSALSWRIFCCYGQFEFQPLSSDGGSTVPLPAVIQNSCVSEQILQRVAEHIWEGFEAVGIRLGLPKAFIDRCKMSHSSHHMQVFHMMYTWRQLAGTQATVRVLMDVLADSVHVCDVDVDAVVRLLKTME